MPEALANTGVKPGVFGVTVTWSVGTLVVLLVTTGVTVTALGLDSDQVKGPTDAVMSAPRLKAFACRVMV
jgi:hypothetical protein